MLPWLRRRLAALILLTAAFVPPTAQASTDLVVQYSALERLLAAQVFTQEGRHYVRGTRDNRCNFGYLEKPHLDADQGRLRFRARFSGRSSWNLLGHCVGLGDSFDLVITAVPYFANGAIRMKDVKVQPVKGGFYASRVCRAMTESLPAQFAFPIAAEARAAVEHTSDTNFRRELKRFSVTAIQIRGDALALSLDLEVAVK